MKKHTRIGLIVVVTVILLLALTVPGLAKKGSNTSCEMRVLTVDNAEKLHFDYMFFSGSLVISEEGDIVKNYCEGKIPFGAKINPGMWYGDFADYCAFFVDYEPCSGNLFTIDKGDIDEGTRVVDLDNVRYWATWWSLEIDSDGNFVGFKEYDPAE